MVAVGDLSGAAEAAPTGAEVTVRGVSKRFGERITAVREVSFTLPPGQFALLTGPSGSGKTTLLNLIAGFDRPDAGEIRVAGQDVAALTDPARFRREVIGFVFQLHHLIAGLTVEENVEVALLPSTRSRAERRERVAAALHDVGLRERGTHLPGELSGGERQRAALARALVGRPRLLLADEPTGSLDSASSAHVLELLHALSRRTGTTVLLVSHEAEAAVHAERVLRMRDGALVADEARAGAPAP